MTKEKDALTMKQRAFVTAYCLGQPDCPEAKGVASRAYKIAYDCENMKESSIYVEACRLTDPDISPKITQAIKEENEKLLVKHNLSAQSLREKICEGLLRETQLGSDASRVRSWELLGKMSGVNFFDADKVETSQKLTIESSEEELMASIASAINDPRVTALFNNKKSEN